MTSITICARILGSPGDTDKVSRAARATVSNDKRAAVDRRRHHPFFADWRWSHRGRRRSIRRITDNSRGSHVILDWYHPSLLFFIVGIYVLSGIDAILTVTLLEFGIAEEANVLMDLLLSESVRLFAGVKALVTGVGLVCLAAYSNKCLFTRLRVDRLIYALFAVYTLLVVYEIRLLMIAESAGWPS